MMLVASRSRAANLFPLIPLLDIEVISEIHKHLILKSVASEESLCECHVLVGWADTTTRW
jgi:hypothetical protein